MDDVTSETQWEMGARFSIGSRTLLFIDQVTRHGQASHQNGWFSFTKQPCAIVVVENSQTRVVSIDRQSWSIEQLRQRIPEFGVALSQLR